jgi:predicted MPP superfamily phosphohydrolase
MKSRIHKIFLAFTLFILFIDGICYVGLRLDFPVFRQTVLPVTYWSATIAVILALFIYVSIFQSSNTPGLFAGFYVFAGIFLAVYIPKLIYLGFFLLELLLKVFSFPLLSLIAHPDGFGEFLLRGPLNLISMASLSLSALAFILITGGMMFGRFNFKVRDLEIRSPNLPFSFDGFRVIHISDLHLGSLHGHGDKIRKAVEMIHRETPDLVLFTGDLVNNLAEEAEGWTEILSEITAGYGQFSILGNHDYGEYYDWKDENSRQANMEKLLAAHAQSGFTALLNRSVRIAKDGEEIWLAGVENWGLPPFKQYGDLNKALTGIPEDVFTILLSHDPSHWDAEVLPQTSVDLTLSGHTHGMQFGIRTRKIRWSPIQMKYPRWIGMYRQGYQYLHVNPGLGYIGYPGRIGIPPEISVITLKRSG